MCNNVVTGTAYDDYIQNFDDANVCIYGNDKLFGGAGNDVFIYSAGKNVIFGFENNDLLQIAGTCSASYNKSKKEVAFKVGSSANAITLRDFTATSFNINDSAQKFS